jgi:hypothetical protein
MPSNSRVGRLSAAVVVLTLCPGVALAQVPAKPDSRLKIPTAVAGAAAAADWASTYYALKHFELRETNPMLQGLQQSPGQLVSVGAAIDAAAFSAWNVTVGRKHPRVAAAGLWGMAGFRAYLVFHNLRNTQRVARRTQ